jgi:hypothetical protein
MGIAALVWDRGDWRLFTFEHAIFEKERKNNFRFRL